MSVFYRPPALSAAVKLMRRGKQATALRNATRAASQKAAENAEAALRREQEEGEEELESEEPLYLADTLDWLNLWQNNRAAASDKETEEEL